MANQKHAGPENKMEHPAKVNQQMQFPNYGSNARTAATWFELFRDICAAAAEFARKLDCESKAGKEVQSYGQRPKNR